MAAKKTMLSKASSKKAVAKKSIPVRSKDGKKLAGSVSVAGKKAPVAKKSVAKASPVKKSATKASPVKKSAVKPGKVSTIKAKTVAVKKVAVKKSSANSFSDLIDLGDGPVSIDFDEIAAEVESSVDPSYAESYKPTNPNFSSEFRVKVRNEGVERYISWSAEIFRNGRKVGTAENRGDGGANYYYFDRREDRSAWEAEATEAYENSPFEGEEDTLFLYLDLLSGDPKLSEA